MRRCSRSRSPTRPQQQRLQGQGLEEEWERRQRGRRVGADDRATLLRLMVNPSYQQTKLGRAYSLGDQRRGQGFWRAAAAYLVLPLPTVMVQGMRLWPGGCWAMQR